VRELLRRRLPPFISIAVLVAFITLAVFRLPDSFVEQLENSQTLSLSQRGWAFRLLALFAIVQAVYVGFAVLRSEHVKDARQRDEKVARLSRAQLMTSLSWNAAAIIFLTIIYGLAAFGFSGFRAGFWLFVFVALVQGAWYFRQIGQVARWLDFQPETVARGAAQTWEPEAADYCPPLARGLVVQAPAPPSR
jgi:MFS family permease